MTISFALGKKMALNISLVEDQIAFLPSIGYIYHKPFDGRHRKGISVVFLCFGISVTRLDKHFYNSQKWGRLKSSGKVRRGKS